MHGPLFCIPRIQLISVSVSRQQRRRGAMISQVTTQLFSGAVKTATHLAPPGDKLFSQCGCTNIFLPKSAAFCPSSFALWAQEAEGLYNLGLNGVTLMSESFTYLIEVSLFYSLFLCTGAEKMVCSQRRTEAGSSHFFGLCTFLEPAAKINS